MALLKKKPPVGVGKQYLEITIEEDGSVEVEAHGFTGTTSCRNATKDIEAQLGCVTKRSVKYGDGPVGFQKVKG